MRLFFSPLLVTESSYIDFHCKVNVQRYTARKGIAILSMEAL